MSITMQVKLLQVYTKAASYSVAAAAIVYSHPATHRNCMPSWFSSLYSLHPFFYTFSFYYTFGLFRRFFLFYCTPAYYSRLMHCYTSFAAISNQFPVTFPVMPTLSVLPTAELRQLPAAIYSSNSN